MFRRGTEGTEKAERRRKKLVGGGCKRGQFRTLFNVL